jgi:hypothetical protein
MEIELGSVDEFTRRQTGALPLSSIPLFYSRPLWAIRIRAAELARSASLAWIQTPTYRDAISNKPGMRSVGSKALCVVRGAQALHDGNYGGFESTINRIVSVGLDQMQRAKTPPGRYEHKAGPATGGLRCRFAQLLLLAVRWP